jgi:DNA-binding IscR family transcriptional regulator
MELIPARVLTLARLSLGYTLDVVAAGLAGLSPTDALLVLAINQANIAPLTRDPDARRAYGDLQHAAPDSARRPATINAIANSLGIPFETARRRLKRLESQGICIITPGAGVVVPEAWLTSPTYLASVMAAHDRTVRLYADLLTGDRLDPLPPPAYDVQDGIPFRGAARLIADYILRSIESLHRVAGDLPTALALLAVLDAALDAPDAAEGAGFGAASASALARRVRLPGETMRRHLVALIDAGLCVRTDKGLSLAPDLLSRPEIRHVIEEHAADVQRLFAGLAERGVVAAWEQAGAAAPRRRA